MKHICNLLLRWCDLSSLEKPSASWLYVVHVDAPRGTGCDIHYTLWKETCERPTTTHHHISESTRRDLSRAVIVGYLRPPPFRTKVKWYRVNKQKHSVNIEGIGTCRCRVRSARCGGRKEKSVYFPNKEYRFHVICWGESARVVQTGNKSGTSHRWWRVAVVCYLAMGNQMCLYSGGAWR